jgi:hypothetical protein
MRAVVAAIVAAFIASVLMSNAPSGNAQQQSGACQGRRADIMTLTDPNTADIDPSQIIGVHASALASFPLPADLPDEARFDPYETTIYTTLGNLVSASMQPDQSIALVLADPDTNFSITVVLPDAEQCAQSADSNALQLMEIARQKVISTLGFPSASGPTPLTGQAIVTGIGFIDQAVAEQGNTGIEIAPVLDIQFDQAAAAASSTGSAATSTPIVGTPQPQVSVTATATPSPAAVTPSPAPATATAVPQMFSTPAPATAP